MKVRYEIENGTNAVKVFYDENIVPSLYQPHYPSGEVWDSFEEADTWAKLYIESIENNDAPYAPDRRGEAGLQKPTAEEIAIMQEEFDKKRNNSIF